MVRSPLRWLMLLCALLLLSCIGSRGKVRIAAGRQGSTAHNIGVAMADVFNKVDGVRAHVLDDTAKRDNLQKLLDGKAELAVAFSDDDGDGEIRTLVPLYELYLYILVWEDSEIEDVPGLLGKRIAIGPEGSGTDAVARRLLQHYGFDEKNVNIVNGKYREQSKQFVKRELDAVFVLGSTESKAVERMLRAPGARLLSLDDPERLAPAMDGIRTKHPYVVSHVIPKHLFAGKPKKPTGVIGVHALLVARSDLRDEVARDLTRAVFEHKVELGQKIKRLRDLDERFDRFQLRFPLHPGASQYYRRDEPPAIFQWAETISLGITLVLLGWSGVAAIAARQRQKRKGKLDDLYAEFQGIVGTYDEAHETPPDQMSDERLAEVREQLQLLRRRAIDSLMAGILEANSAFVVFHDYLRWELQEIERIQRDRRARGVVVDASASADDDGAIADDDGAIADAADDDGDADDDGAADDTPPLQRGSVSSASSSWSTTATVANTPPAT
jgi:TRAP transporter TAXI family solute receptor